MLLSSKDDDEVGVGDKLVLISERLNMNEEQLNRMKKENGTKTARAIVRACFPSSIRADVDLEDIEEDFRYAIHGKTLSLSLMS